MSGHPVKFGGVRPASETKPDVSLEWRLPPRSVRRSGPQVGRTVFLVLSESDNFLQ